MSPPCATRSCAAGCGPCRCCRQAGDDARPLCVLHRHLLRAGRRGGTGADSVDRGRLPAPAATAARAGSFRRNPALRPQRGGCFMSEAVAPKRRSWLLALPLLVFTALAALFLARLNGGDPSKIPSALIGRPAPQTALPPLQGLLNNGA